MTEKLLKSQMADDPRQAAECPSVQQPRSELIRVLFDAVLAEPSADVFFRS